MAQSGTKIAAVRETRKGATIYKTNERPGTRAQVRYVRVSAYKAREVLDLVRGKHVNEADEILQFTERDISNVIRKALASAVANATNNDSQDPETLFVTACYADEGPTLKRWRPRARGRATRIRKRTCHITIIVSRGTDLELRLRSEAEARSGRAGAGAAGRASRRARVAESKRAAKADAAHDHDHDHDHDAVDADVAVDAVTVTDEATDASTDGPTGIGDIKGNASSMKYHVPGSQWYEQTDPEVWFATTEEAEAAGYEPAGGAEKQDVDADEKDEN
jgi:large subunit ribosomal protein L22